MLTCSPQVLASPATTAFAVRARVVRQPEDAVAVWATGPRNLQDYQDFASKGSESEHFQSLTTDFRVVPTSGSDHVAEASCTCSIGMILLCLTAPCLTTRQLKCARCSLPPRERCDRARALQKCFAAVQISRRAFDGSSAQACSKQRAFLIMCAVDKQLMGWAAPSCIKSRLGPQAHMGV